MNIICGTDFSEHAVQAGLAAAALARRLGDTLVLAHVWDEALGEGLWEDFHSRMVAAVRFRLHEHAVRLRETGAIVKEEILSGMPDVELAELAWRLDARLLVVGSLGRRSGEWLLGSVAEHAAVRSSVPTLVVRSAVPFKVWARGERPLKIFAAFDFTGTAETALRWMKCLAAAGPCEVVVGYVDRPLGEAARLGITGQFLRSHNPPQVQQILERELSERVGVLLGEGVARVRVEPSIGRDDSRLVEMAREEQADLVVAGTHQRHGLGRVAHPSISRGLLRDAPMSVACIPGARVETIERQSAPLRRVPRCERPLRTWQQRDSLCIRRGISRWHRAFAPRSRAVAPVGNTVDSDRCRNRGAAACAGAGGRSRARNPD